MSARRSTGPGWLFWAWFAFCGLVGVATLVVVFFVAAYFIAKAW